MKRTVKEYIYKPSSYNADPNHKNDKSKCEAEVSDHDSRMASYSQCSRKPVEFIEGIGFCKLHAIKVKRGLGILDANITKFVAELKYGEPALAKLTISSETEKKIDIQSSENIIGNIYIFTGYQNKADRFSHNRQYFDDMDSALKWILKQCKGAVEYNEKEFKDSIETLNKISSLIST